MMKKWQVLISALLMSCVFLSGCGSSDTQKSGSKEVEEVNVLPPIEAGASCFNENSATDSKELRRLTLSPQA